MYLTEKQKLQLLMVVLKEQVKGDSECASLLQEILDQQNIEFNKPELESSSPTFYSRPLANPDNFKPTEWGYKTNESTDGQTIKTS